MRATVVALAASMLLPLVSSAQQHGHATLDSRVAMYTQALNLDVQQQAHLRSLLVQQREQVNRIWSDTDSTAAARVHATQFVANTTADRIRAMLNDEQRKRYNPPKAPRPIAEGAQATSIEKWMAGGHP
jgi:hypothetical protein